MKKFFDYNFDIYEISVALHLFAQNIGTLSVARPWHGILLNLSGVLEFEFFEKNETVVVVPGSVVYIPKGQRYILKKSEDSECYVIDFLLNSDFEEDCFCFKIRSKEMYLPAFATASKVWKQKKPGYIMKAKSCFYEIMYMLQNEYFTDYVPVSKSKVIQPAVEYISKNYTDHGVSVGFLAKMCGVSDTYFRKIFFSAFGVMPKKYINNLKIMRAKELLASGMYSVAQTARSCGYSDDCQFSREFKKAVGQSPASYKKTWENSED